MLAALSGEQARLGRPASTCIAPPAFWCRTLLSAHQSSAFKKQFSSRLRSARACATDCPIFHRRCLLASQGDFTVRRAADCHAHLFYAPFGQTLSSTVIPSPKERRLMKKIDVERDLKRSKFLITAMIAQVVLVLFAMFCYWIYLKF